MNPRTKERIMQGHGLPAGEIRRRLDSQMSKKPEIFGYIIDQLMTPVGDLRQIAYDIVILKTETPKDFNEVILIRTQAGVNPNKDKQLNIQKIMRLLCLRYNSMKSLLKNGFTVDDVISNECNIAATVADVVSNNILDYWAVFINKQVKGLEKYLPHSDEVAFLCFKVCVKKLGVQKTISTKIDQYSRVFPDNDLPNAIADFASLTLNNFVSSVGQGIYD